MKIAIATMTALAAITLALAPGFAAAKSINGQVSQPQIDSYCAGTNAAGGADVTFHLKNGKSVTGTIDCSTAGQSKLSAANAGADDAGGAESATDADSTHED
jgi:hypothetical protein